jgi:phenylalanine-4-hydroxylase
MKTTVHKPSKHGLAAGVACQPEHPDWTIPQGWEQYSAAEHATWKTLYERQSKLLPGRAWCLSGVF